jgi:DNA invertase Pin-like site-specific DNA recombinase
LGFHRVETIDDDLGVSGSGFAERPGFQRLLTIVCSGTASAVLALEASRLARNDRDWSQLVELGAISNVVLIDHDGIYDPRLVNDRLLAGATLLAGSLFFPFDRPDESFASRELPDCWDSRGS